MTKKFCTTHHLYYSASECPCCVSDRANALANKYYREEKQEAVMEKEATQDALDALKAKFNKK